MLSQKQPTIGLPRLDCQGKELARRYIHRQMLELIFKENSLKRTAVNKS